MVDEKLTLKVCLFEIYKSISDVSFLYKVYPLLAKIALVNTFHLHINEIVTS